MKIMRLSAIVVILSTLVVGFVLDQEPRTFDDFAPVDRVGVPATSTGTWFCPGGSGEGGSAVVGLEIVNGDEVEFGNISGSTDTFSDKFNVQRAITKDRHAS